MSPWFTSQSRDLRKLSCELRTAGLTMQTYLDFLTSQAENLEE